MNPVIIVGLIVQWIISRSSRLGGAVVGFLITTGILIWGDFAYGQGNYLTILGIPLPYPAFLIACTIWYGFDTNELINARKTGNKEKQALKSPLMNDTRVVNFYQTTQNAWASGKLASLSKSFENEGKKHTEDFIKKYLPYQGSALQVFFEKFPPLSGEFLVGFGNLNATGSNGYFVLTNHRLMMRDGKLPNFRIVILANVDTYQMQGRINKSLVFKMRSGQEITFEKPAMYPADKILSTLITQRIDP